MTVAGCLYLITRLVMTPVCCVIHLFLLSLQLFVRATPEVVLGCWTGCSWQLPLLMWLLLLLLEVAPHFRFGDSSPTVS